MELSESRTLQMKTVRKPAANSRRAQQRAGLELITSFLGKKYLKVAIANARYCLASKGSIMYMYLERCRSLLFQNQPEG